MDLESTGPVVSACCAFLCSRNAIDSCAFFCAADFSKVFESAESDLVGIDFELAGDDFSACEPNEPNDDFTGAGAGVVDVDCVARDVVEEKPLVDEREELKPLLYDRDVDAASE